MKTARPPLSSSLACAPGAAPAPALRLDRLDALRGLAMVWMTVFHFCFDLNEQGWIRQNFYTDPVWTWQRSAIVSLFLLCAGVGQAVAWRQGLGWARFGRRWLQVAGCAGLVSLGSWWMYPQSFIYFGVLHALAVMLLLARLLAPWVARHPVAVWGLALGLVGLKFATVYVANNDLLPGTWFDFFNKTGPNVLGLVTRLPVTQDYVPLVPWLGVLLAGLALGLLRAPGAMLAGPLAAGLRPLALLGRWSLSYYLLHQPVLIGALMALRWVMPA